MEALKDISIPDKKEIETQAMTALLSRLGPAGAAFFLRDHFSRATDYIVWKESIFGDDDVTSLVEQMKAERDASSDSTL